MKKVKILVSALLLTVIFSISAAAEGTAQEGLTEWDQGVLRFKSEDGNFQTRFDIRMYINGAYFFEDKNEFSNGTHLRKGRFAAKAILWKTWNTEWDIDIAEGVVETKDMFISYIGLNNTHIKMGNFKMPLGLEELTSSRYITFIERAYPMLAFETDRRTGLEYSHWGYKYNLRAAVFGQPMDNVKNKTADETGNGYALRLALAPIRNDNVVLHTGGAYVLQHADNSSRIVEFQSEPETKIGDVEILGIKIPYVRSVQKIGLETGLVMNSLNFQAEYIKTDVIRDAGYTDATFSGGYAFVSWILTGERRHWDETQGEFGQVIPSNTKRGAWEVAARFSNLMLSDTDAGLLGGNANNITLGLNWYPNPNIKFMLNYTMVDNSENATNDGLIGNDDFSVLHTMLIAYF